ncbi:Protein PHLOEM PROTEIN 2-LIKE A1 [Glycine soja]|uniref:Protein PHLOEM PROTEIN 2-LIKE A1 n=1 Tax=Glycine soja TaxID=3848 RepID=A0A445EZS1_GLYSO|nr:Protein PHLOEM PROTEIN 2-LIKE A1 [Glycine soja]
MGASESHEKLQSQQPQPQSQHVQHQQPQPQLHEPTRRRESSLLPPDQGNTKASKDRTKAVVDNNATMMPVKSLKGLPIPHNYEHILKSNADSPVDKSLLDKLYAGVFLDHKTKASLNSFMISFKKFELIIRFKSSVHGFKLWSAIKYWVEKKSNGNCFMLYARALSITWAENPNYWKWVQHKEESGSMIELAKLKMVCWLEVNGKFGTGMLSPGILYQVSFIVMLKDSAQGWELPINVRLVLPGGKKQQHKENLMEKSRESWIEILVGEFVASEKDVGEMEISMYEHEGGMWKTGLVIEGVAIKPKN